MGRNTQAPGEHHQLLDIKYTHSLVGFVGCWPFLYSVHNLWRDIKSAHSLKGILHAYPGRGWPGILAFKRDPGIDIRSRQEFGYLRMFHHARLGFSQDAHGYRMPD